VLVPVERPLVLANHDRIEPVVWVGHRRQQRRGLRAARPRQHPTLTNVEETRPRSAHGQRPAHQLAQAAAPGTSPDLDDPRWIPAHRTRTATHPYVLS